MVNKLLVYRGIVLDYCELRATAQMDYRLRANMITRRPYCTSVQMPLILLGKSHQRRRSRRRNHDVLGASPPSTNCDWTVRQETGGSRFEPFCYGACLATHRENAECRYHAEKRARVGRCIGLPRSPRRVPAEILPAFGWATRCPTQTSCRQLLQTSAIRRPPSWHRRRVSRAIFATTARSRKSRSVGTRRLRPARCSARLAATPRFACRPPLAKCRSRCRRRPRACAYR